MHEGRLLIVGCKNGFIDIFDTDNAFNKMKFLKTFGNVTKMMFSTNAYGRDELAVSMANGLIKLYDLKEFNYHCTICAYTEGEVYSILQVPD